MVNFIKKHKWFIIGALDILAICVIGWYVIDRWSGWWMILGWYMLQFILAKKCLENEWNDLWADLLSRRICPVCYWIGTKSQCVRFKHDDGNGPLLCPDCYEITEELTHPPRR